MTEKDLVELWNDKRRQIISAQMPSVIALAVITVMAMMGYFWFKILSDPTVTRNSDAKA